MISWSVRCKAHNISKHLLFEAASAAFFFTEQSKVLLYSSNRCGG